MRLIVQPLSGAWRFRRLGDSQWHIANVPGCVHTDLLANGEILDPFLGTNELDVQWIAKEDWEYQCEFSPTATMLNQDRVELVCYGLDTLAEISMNGHSLGETSNMFRQYKWNISKLLQIGTNVLSVVFRSPVTYIESRQKTRRLPAIVNNGSAHIRKAQSHYGWDFAPQLPSIGIWNEICLQGFGMGRITDIHIQQKHETGKVILDTIVESIQWNDGELQLSVTVVSPDGDKYEYKIPSNANLEKLQVIILDPQLWWPNGLGDQPLYQVKVALLDGEHLVDDRSLQIGLRFIELCRDIDQWGNNFMFKVNGVPVFAKGANWIPADCFPSRITAERLNQLVQSAAMANMNMLRVWGGGYYENEEFYNACDRYGILVWQDFMFASAAYPLDEDTFHENVIVEIIEIIHRLRHHACLTLWCGNNDIEYLWVLWRYHFSVTCAFQNFFFYELPKIVRSEDGEHPYWPSSPSSGIFLKNTNSDASGDTHLWQVWHELKPITYFRTRFPRFVSEFGIESLPDINTITSFAGSRDNKLQSKVIKHHQRSVGGNRKMIYYLTSRFRVPREFSELIYLSQIVQAEAMRVGVEHWRRNRKHCNGALFWQFNDCWPAISWSSIDYEGRWKALQYMARRFFAPISISLDDNGSQISIYIANDTRYLWQGELHWTLETLGGQHVDSGQSNVFSPALESICIETLNFSNPLQKHGRTDLVFVAELWHNNECHVCQIVTFAPEKEMALQDPNLVTNMQLTENLLTITISAEHLARFVVLSLVGVNVVFSDNYFDLPAGRTKQVTCQLPSDWNIDQAINNIRIHSLADVLPHGSVLSDRLQHLWAALQPISLARRIFSAFMR